MSQLSELETAERFLKREREKLLELETIYRNLEIGIANVKKTIADTEAEIEKIKGEKDGTN